MLKLDIGSGGKLATLTHFSYLTCDVINDVASQTSSLTSQKCLRNLRRRKSVWSLQNVNNVMSYITSKTSKHIFSIRLQNLIKIDAIENNSSITAQTVVLSFFQYLTLCYDNNLLYTSAVLLYAKVNQKIIQLRNLLL